MKRRLAEKNRQRVEEISSAPVITEDKSVEIKEEKKRGRKATKK